VALVNSKVAFWRRIGELLGRAWWAGAGVIVAILLAVVGFFLASGGSPAGTTEINNVHGTCDAAGNNNTVNCVTPSAGPRR
jgi:hypothetical protein